MTQIYLIEFLYGIKAFVLFCMVLSIVYIISIMIFWFDRMVSTELFFSFCKKVFIFQICILSLLIVSPSREFMDTFYKNNTQMTIVDADNE